MYVLMITPNKFPNGDAGAVRDYYFAKIYRELGYDVIHIGEGRELQNGTYEGVKYYTSYKMRKSFRENLNYFLNYSSRISEIYSLIENSCGYPSLIHIYDIPIGGIFWATHLAQKLNIPIIHDSVEWYSPCQFKMGRLAYPYVLKEITNRFMIRKPISVIAISTFLENYFQQKYLRTVRIPVIMDVYNANKSLGSTDERIKMIYAGSPGSKDHLREIVEAISNLSEIDKTRLSLDIFGIDEESLKNKVGMVIPSSICVHGRVSRERIIEAMENADYSILLRPENERYAKAGFPTKVVESMAHGVPVICNLTSDLARYLVDGENSIIVKGCTSSAFYDALVRVLGLSRNEMKIMKNNARNQAEKSFDYKLYIDRMNEFINYECRLGKKDV